jgi:hypothetical protein
MGDAEALPGNVGPGRQPDRRHLLGYVGDRPFVTGAFIDRSGPGRDSDVVHAAIQYGF